MVDVLHGDLAAYEHFEIALDLRTGHADHVIFGTVDHVVGGKGLGGSSVDGELLLVLHGIAVEREILHRIHFFLSDACPRGASADFSGGHFLTHSGAGESHHQLGDLDVEFLLRVFYCGFKRSRRLARVEDGTVTDSGRGPFLVIKHFSVLAADAGDTYGYLAGA